VDLGKAYNFSAIQTIDYFGVNNARINCYQVGGACLQTMLLCGQALHKSPAILSCPL
jgi:hypothetical protein